MTQIARMLTVVLLFFPLSVKASEAIQWSALYQQQWHPSEQSIINAGKAFVNQSLPTFDAQSLIDLSATERQQVAQAALVYLRGTSLNTNQTDSVQYAQLVIDLAIMLKMPLLESEGYYHLARDSLVRRQLLQHSERQLEQALTILTSQSVADEHLHTVLLAHLYLLRGQLQLSRMQYINAIESAETTLVLSEAQQMPWLVSNAMFLLGESQLGLQQLDLAIEAFYQALDISEQQRDEHLITKALVNIGMVYQRQGRIKEAVGNLEQAVEHYQRLNDAVQAARTLTLLGELYHSNDQLNQAMAIYLNALNLNQALNNAKGVANISAQIADVYRQFDELVKANEYFQQAKLLYRQLHDEQALLNLAVLNAKLLHAGGLTKQAIELLRDATPQLQTNTDFDVRVRNTLIELLLEQQEFQSASELMTEELEYLRQNMSSNVHQRVNQVQSSHQLQLLKKQLTKSKQQAQEKSVLSERYLNYASALLVIAVLAVGSILSQWRKLRVQRQNLREAEHDAVHTQFTGLGNGRMLLPVLVKETLKLQRQQENWYASGTVGEHPPGKLLALIHVPMLANLYQRNGYESARKIEMKYGQFLRSRFADPTLFQPRDDIIAVILPGTNLNSSAERVIDTLHGFAPPGVTSGLPLSVAMMHYPFTQKNSKAVNANAASEMLLLALSAAMDLTNRHEQDAWIGLEAIEAAPVSLFHSRARENTLLGINKGFIRVLSNFDKSEVNWHES
ncbi:tetratricopeptide repeat protein [Neiella marina]|uniref:Tetratricopeptide repeat protein n=1 Tax=Neiella holothuriorum TaxID=2870530 RepID=A0ABS7EHN8_9GAMM|nr:tetratricopeptide repeat protein [Neiella holothuriorum]MBW8191851.1 tetratricopeptide repeat protein [Neiella holothuriorum]